jgi:transketolase
MDQSSLLTMIFGRTLVDLGRKHKDLVVLDANLSSATRTAYFAAAFPDRFIDVGFSEGDLYGTAAGLAASGLKVFVSTFASMLGRGFDQIAHSICLPKLPVRIIGTHAGFGFGPAGAPRQALFDLAVMRALPDLAILNPADEDECRQALEFAAGYDAGPVYIRLGTAENAKVRGFDATFRFGWAKVVQEGSDVGILSTGTMLSAASEAALQLAAEGVSARLIHCSTIKPLREDLLIMTARHTGAVVTVEEHSTVGGFGGMVCEVLARQAPVPVEMVAVPDTFGESGLTQQLLDRYGLNAKGVVEAARRALERKK